MARLTRQVGIFITALWLMLASSAAFAGSPSVLTFTKSFGASSIALNGSTSLTFNLSLGNTGGGGGTGAFGFTDTLPAGLVVSTPNGLSAVTCSGGSTTGTVTASPGMGSITLAGMNIAMLGSCSFSVNVTGTTEGVKNNSVTTTAGYYTNTPGGGLATVTATANLTVAAAAATQPIPNSAPASTTAGIGRQPTTVDLSKGQGPDMTVCMMNAVKAMPGFSQAVYLGQDQFGVASIDLKDGRYLSFYPLAASTSTARAPGLYFSGSNKASLVTTCGTFDVAPAIYNLAKLGELLAAGQSTDVRVNINTDGVTTYVRDGTTYVVRPEFYVALGATTAAGLSAVGDAYSFNDGAGSTQLLRGAFSDPGALAIALASGGHLGSLVAQIDGTYIYTSLSGVRYLLKAEMQLIPPGIAPSDELYYPFSINTFLYRGNTLSWWQMMKVTNLGPNP